MIVKLDGVASYLLDKYLAKHFRYQPFELIVISRLGDKVIGALVKRHVQLRFQPGCGIHDHGNRSQLMAVPDKMEHFPAADLRQIKIQENNIWQKRSFF